MSRLYHGRVYNDIELDAHHSRILALDLGKKRIGLAISDPLRITARACPIWSAPTSAPTSTALGELVQEREVGLDPDGQSR